MILPDHTDAALVRLDDLVANPDNPRSQLGDITDLAESIATVGLLTPLLVVELHEENTPTVRWMVVDGHRRLAALQHLDYDDEILVRVVEMSRTDRLLAALATQGQPLDPIDEARAFRALIDLDLTQRQIAERVGCNQSHVSRRLALLDADEETQAAVAAGTTKLRDAEAKARGKEPPAPKAKKRTPGIIDDPTSYPDFMALQAENRRLREVAEKARTALHAAREELDTEPTPSVELARDRVDIVLHVMGNVRVQSGKYVVPTRSLAEAIVRALDEASVPAVQGCQPFPPGSIGAMSHCQCWFANDIDDDQRPCCWCGSNDDMDSDSCHPARIEPEVPPADVPPEWSTKQPWGTYKQSSVERIIGVIRKATNPDTCRRVVVWELANEGRVEITEAATARLHELGQVAA